LDCFSIQIEEICLKEFLNKKEKQWIITEILNSEKIKIFGEEKNKKKKLICLAKIKEIEQNLNLNRKEDKFLKEKCLNCDEEVEKEFLLFNPKFMENALFEVSVFWWIWRLHLIKLIYLSITLDFPIKSHSILSLKRFPSLVWEQFNL